MFFSLIFFKALKAKTDIECDSNQCTVTEAWQMSYTSETNAML